MLCVLSSSYFLKNERKPLKTPHTSLIMLNLSVDNSKATTESSLIKSSKLDEIPNYSLSFKLIVIIAFKTLENNQCPRNWFNTQAFTTKDKTSTIIWDMYQIKGGGTGLVVLIVVYWL